jgi:murein hydrolase activator
MNLTYKIVTLLLVVSICSAESTTMTQTKNKLKQLESQMTQLQQHLNNAHDQQSTLKNELSRTEKQIQEGVQKLNKTQSSVEEKQHQITHLQQQVDLLSNKLQTQQQLLARHVRARYKMGEYQPLKWLFHQDSPYTVDRFITFYQYLVRSRQHIMDDVKKTKLSLDVNQAKLHQELIEQKRLQQELTVHQQTLDHDKQRRMTLIQSITHDIQNKQQTLKAYQINKANLSNLLKTLTQQSVIQTRRPFAQMRKKLHKPVMVSGLNLQKMNQGLIFFANEGTPVTSIFPGKVVFSDWLNGYGLLLIVDHGWGFMTLYANNKDLIRRKGDIVNQGDKIATVGHTGTLKQNGLYFEIRHQGKAINPLEWII